jgi:hypothetical protein
MSELLDLLNSDDEPSQGSSWKSILIMVLLFVFIVSDVFVNNFISLFGNSMFDKGKLRFTGALLQAISFALIYIFITYIFNLNRV